MSKGARGGFGSAFPDFEAAAAGADGATPSTSAGGRGAVYAESGAGVTGGAAGLGGGGRYKPLVFSAAFESGNVGRVAAINDHEYDVEIQPDTNNPRHRVWFYFCVENVTVKGQRVLIHITNFSKSKSLYREGMAPLVRSASRPEWQPVPEKHVFYYRCPRHRKSYVMSFAFEFDRVDEPFYFAYSYPYTYTDVQQYLASLERRKLPFFSREVLCRTVQNRRVDLITITDPSTGGGDADSDGARGGAGGSSPSKSGSSIARSRSEGALAERSAKGSSDGGPVKAAAKRRGGKGARRGANGSTAKSMVFITCRVHPGETPAQYICQGIIDALTADTPEAAELRRLYVWKIVPMLNPDGVFLGNYRCSYLGDDLNRHWLAPSFWAHREIAATKARLLEYYDSPTANLDCYIDIHAHTTCYGSFMYANSGGGGLESKSLLPRLLHSRSPDFFFERTKFDQDPRKRGTGRRTLGALLSGVNCYTLEVSFFATSAMPTASRGAMNRKDLFTPGKYLRLGHDVALTFLEYHEVVHRGEPVRKGVPRAPSAAAQSASLGGKSSTRALGIASPAKGSRSRRMPTTPIAVGRSRRDNGGSFVFPAAGTVG